MQPGHGALLDAATKPAAHYELRAFAKRLHERRELAEVISQIGVAHDNPPAADVVARIDIGAAESSSRRPQHFAAVGENYLGSSVGRAIDDENLAGYFSAGQPFLTPIHKLADGDLFVQGRDDDA